MKTIYVMFSSTHKTTGRFIRAVTQFDYNHVSVGFNPTSDTWYSFARRVRSNPWSGGFVKETWSRLCDGGDISVCICSLDNVTGDLRSEGVDGGILPREGRRGRSRRCRVDQKEGYAGKTK